MVNNANNSPHLNSSAEQNRNIQQSSVSRGGKLRSTARVSNLNEQLISAKAMAILIKTTTLSPTDESMPQLKENHDISPMDDVVKNRNLDHRGRLPDNFEDLLRARAAQKKTAEVAQKTLQPQKASIIPLDDEVENMPQQPTPLSKQQDDIPKGQPKVSPTNTAKPAATTSEPAAISSAPSNVAMPKSRVPPPNYPYTSDSNLINFPKDRIPRFSKLESTNQYGNIPKGQPQVWQYDDLPQPPTSINSKEIQYDILPAGTSVTYSKIPSSPPSNTNFFTKTDADQLLKLKTKHEDSYYYEKLTPDEKEAYEASGKNAPPALTPEELIKYRGLVNKRNANLEVKLREKAGPSPLSNLTRSEQKEFRALVIKQRLIGRYSLQKAKNKNDPEKFPLPKTPPTPLRSLEKARYNELLKKMDLL